MKKFVLNLVLALSLVGLMWPQAQPKPSPSPTPHATAPATTPGPCPANYYRNVNGVCVHRPVKTQNSAVPAGLRPNAEMDRIRFRSPVGALAVITAELRSGYRVIEQNS